MVVSALAKLLTAELGTVVAAKVLAVLRTKRSGADKVKSAEALMAAGTIPTAVGALNQVFGNDFLKALTESLRPDAHWSYEAGVEDYRTLQKKPSSSNSARILREELNINLDRVAALKAPDAQLRNYFRGVFFIWKQRYVDLLGTDADAQSTFDAIDQMLDGKRRSFADAFRLLSGTGLGTVGAILLLQAVLIATGTGVGVVAAITAWFAGLPLGPITAFAVSGAVLLALSYIAFTTTSAMTAAVKAAYKLLERRADPLAQAA